MKNLMKTTLMTALFLAVFTVQAMAASLVDLKSDGVVGERTDGLIGIVVSNPQSDVKSMVNQINDDRMDKYRSIATKNGIALNKVQALAGEKLVAQTPGGQYVMTLGGEWVRK